MKLQVKIKNVYGLEKIYPICKQAILLADLAKQITFTGREISLLKELGYIIEVIQQGPVTL